MAQLDQAIITDPMATPEAPWYADFNNIATIVVVYSLVCGIVAALVAKNNGRSVPLGFLSGIFFGQFGIMTYMIMGENKSITTRH